MTDPVIKAIQAAVPVPRNTKYTKILVVFTAGARADVSAQRESDYDAVIVMGNKNLIGLPWKNIPVFLFELDDRYTGLRENSLINRENIKLYRDFLNKRMKR